MVIKTSVGGVNLGADGATPSAESHQGEASGPCAQEETAKSAEGAVPVVKRWEFLVAIVAALAAVMLWLQSAATETRQISNDLLDRFDGDEMWTARLTLQRYYFILAADDKMPANAKKKIDYLTEKTAGYFRFFVYQRASNHEPLPELINFKGDTEKQYEFFRQVDQSRRRVKNFFEELIVFSNKGVITRTADAILKGRVYPHAADFLECFWLPFEQGQNAALYQRQRLDDEKDKAREMITWYRDAAKRAEPKARTIKTVTVKPAERQHVAAVRIDPCSSIASR